MWTVFVLSLVFFIVVGKSVDDDYTTPLADCAKSCDKNPEITIELDPATKLIPDITEHKSVKVVEKVLNRVQLEINGENDVDDPNGILTKEGYSEKIRRCNGNKECRATYSSAATNMGKAANGLDAGFNIFAGLKGLVNENKLAKRLTKAAFSFVSSLTPFLAGIAPIVELFIFNEDSDELQRIDNILNVVEQGFSWMDRKFDKIEQTLTEIQDELAKNAFDSSLRNHIKFIHTTADDVKAYYKEEQKCLEKKLASSVELKAAKSMLDVDTYNRQYDSIDALRQAFMGLGSFSGRSKDICGASAKFVKAVRQDMIKVGVNYFTKMVSGIKSYLTIGKLLGKDKHEYDNLENLLNTTAQRLKWCDDQLLDNLWQYQFGKDVEKWMGDFQAQDWHYWEKDQLSMRIQEELTKKYPWRNWFVLVSGIVDHQVRVQHPNHLFDSAVKRYNVIAYSVKPEYQRAEKFNNNFVNKRLGGGTKEVIESFVKKYKRYPLVAVFNDSPGQFWHDPQNMTNYIHNTTKSWKYVLTFG